MAAFYNGKKFHRVKDAVLYRDGYRCVVCKANENLTFDHIVPKSRGGKRTIQNGQTLCGDCNLRKGARNNDEWNIEERIRNYVTRNIYATTETA